MNFYELQQYLSGKKVFTNIKRYQPEIHQAILDVTSFLPDDTGLTERCKIIQDGIESYSMIPECSVCGKEKVRFINKKLSATCSQKCSRKLATAKAKKTFQTKYGVDNPFKDESVKNKIRETNLERYGNESFTRTDEYKEKTKKTCQERYGEDHHLKSSETRDKIKNSLIEKFGVDNPFKDSEIKKKIQGTLKERYGVEFSSHARYDVGVLDKLLDRRYMEESYNSYGAEWIINDLNVSKKTVYDYLLKHEIDLLNDGRSFKEKEVQNFIESLGFSVECSRRNLIHPYEIDLYIPEKNLAIEFNGIFWHSTVFKDRNYHQKKSLMCKDKGIKLIHVWEDDWDNKKEIVQNKIAFSLGISERIYARKCDIVYPSTKKIREFYNTNHIQGFVRATTHIGLEYGGELVACVSFLDTGDGIFDLNRYATSKSVVGGFTRLLREFKKSFEWDTIFTFAHLDYSHGNLYGVAGFDKIRITEPGLWYVKGERRHRREQFMKHKLKDKLENFDDSLTERENMEAHGFVQLFDAGSIRFELTSK